MGSLNNKIYATQTCYLDMSENERDLPHNEDTIQWREPVASLNTKIAYVGFNRSDFADIDNTTYPGYADVVLYFYSPGSIASEKPRYGKINREFDADTLTWTGAGGTSGRPETRYGIATITKVKEINDDIYLYRCTTDSDFFATDDNFYGVYLHPDQSGDYGYFYGVPYNNGQYKPYIMVEWDDVAITEFTVTNATNTVYDPTTLTLTGNHIEKFDIYNNGHKIGSNTYTVPNSGLVVGENNIYVVAYDNYGKKAQSETITITLKTTKPTITEVTVTNDTGLIDSPTTVTWQSTLQNAVNIYNNDTLILAITGTAKSAIIPKGKLVEGSNRIKVEVVKNDSTVPNSTTTAYRTATINLDRLEPSVAEDSLALSSSNIDDSIVISWESVNQSRFEIYQNSNLVANGTTATSVTLEPNTFKTGLSDVMLIVYWDSGFDTIKATDTISTTFTCNTPVILNLEPDNLTRNINEIITATFETNDFCDRWELKSDLFTAYGTTDRKVVFGANAFSKGSNSITLTIYYSPPWSNGSVTRTAIKTSTFTGYGTPDAPVLKVMDIYSTATPVIEWETSSEQTEYSYVLLQGDTEIDSGSAVSTDNSFTLPTLTDLTEYTVKVSIKNKYGLSSSYSVATFNTLFSDILLPDFWLMEGDNCVQVTVSGVQESTFGTISVYRKDKFSEWTEIAILLNTVDTITDYTCSCNIDVEYKLRVFNTSGAYKETESKSIKISLINYWLTNIEDFTHSYRMDFVETSQRFIRNVVYKQYTNQMYPRAFRGNTKYGVISLTVELPNEQALEFVNFIETANTYSVFCYRTWKGEKYFVSAVLDSMEAVNPLMMSISLELTQVSFSEEHMYTGSGTRRLTYLNGEYALDGSIDLSGFADVITTP